jgi:hypothetical protein
MKQALLWLVNPPTEGPKSTLLDLSPPATEMVTAVQVHC